MNNTDIAKWLFMTTGNVGSFDIDGSGDYSDDNGNTITINSDGSGEYRGVDGSWADFYSDGRGDYHGADGSWGNLYSDGSGDYHGADGSWGDLCSDGSGSYHGADGSWGDLYSNGNVSFHDADGNWNEWNVNDYDNDCDNSSSSSSWGDVLITAAMGAAISKAIAKDRRSSTEDYDYYDNDITYDYTNNSRIAEQKRGSNSSLKGLIAFFIIMILVGIFFLLYKEYSKWTTVGVSADDLIGMDHYEVEEILEEKGFLNITATEECDIDINSLELEDKIIRISIESNDHFKAKDRFLKESPIIIQYHAIQNIRVPISAKESKKSNYKKVKSLLVKAGFVDIKTRPKKDLIFGWLNKEDMVDTITIDGFSNFEKNEYFRPDVEVVITYHSYKNKK